MKLKLVPCVPSLWCPFLPVLCHRRPFLPHLPLGDGFGGLFLMNKWPLWAFPVVLSQCPWTKMCFAQWWCHGHGQVIFSFCFMLWQPNPTWMVLWGLQQRVFDFLVSTGCWCAAGRGCEENHISFLLCFYPPAQPAHYWRLYLGFVFIFLRETQD